MKNKGFLKLNYFITLSFICLPFFGFFSRGNFLRIQNLDLPIIFSSIWVSLRNGLIAMFIVILIGLPAGYFMAKTEFKGKEFLNLLFHLPQVLPPAVTGLLLLITYGSNGFIGRHLAILGIRTSFTSLAVVLTFIFVALPLFIRGVSVAFMEVNPKLEETAQILGDSSFQVFRRISFPLAKRGIVVSFMMAWSRGLSEFGATMMFAGNLQGITQTLPLAIYTALETNLNNALFLAFIMFLISLSLLILTHLLTKEQE